MKQKVKIFTSFVSKFTAACQFLMEWLNTELDL